MRVSEGNTNPHTEWALRAQGTIVVDTTKLPWVRRDPFFNVLDFGADSTGTTDSWQAFKDWSQAITAAGGGIGLVPAGTYLIEKFTEIYEPGSPDDFRFEGCEGLWLIGYGATLELRPKGQVQLHHLPDGVTVDKHMVCPFYIYDCHNVCLEGFEVNGHADQVQFNDVIEPGGHCVTVENSTHVTIRHMRLHDGWTDGISVRAAFTEPRLACRNVVIENCEVYANVCANIAVHETRHIRISDCRIYNAGLPSDNSSGMGIDIEPDLRIGTEFDKDIEPPGSSRFIIIENCELYNNYKQLSVARKYSRVRVQGCFIDNQRDNPRPVILSLPHCALLDSEIDTRSGLIDVNYKDSDGNNVFTMERCLIRSNTRLDPDPPKSDSGSGLFIGTDKPNLIRQALVANNRFINESKHPLQSGRRFPSLSHNDNDTVLQLIFRDNYVFLPQACYRPDNGISGQMAAVDAAVHLAENNVYETDHCGGGDFFAVIYGTGQAPKFGVLVRNERFISAGDGTGFRPGDNTLHDNTFPYSKGVSAVGTDLAVIGSGGGQLTVDLAGGSRTLSWEDLAYAMVKTIGDNLPGERTLTFPAPIGDNDSFQRTVRNQCTGLFDVIVSTGAGSPVPLKSGQSASLIFDSHGVGRTVEAPMVI